jgi:ABC-type molybdate transport system substrate-binding protein
VKKAYRIVVPFVLALFPGFDLAQEVMVAAGAGYRAPLLKIYQDFTAQTGIAV